MKILNLTNKGASDIKFEVSSFPDGQQQVTLVNLPIKKNTSYHDGMYEVQLKARLNNFKDLELIICATKSLNSVGTKHIHLYVPFFLGSRSDRKFEEGSNNYLKDVICPIINSLNFESVTVIDPHSDVLEACLNNFKKFDNLELTRFTIRDLCGYTHGKNPMDNYILISPDAGANKKIFKLAEQIGYTGDIITCSKSRDTDGKLSKVNVPVTFEQLKSEKDFIIIDDICDGGATFINIAKAIKDERKSAKIYLIVTHGIFSKGLTELKGYFDGIYCTNSYKDYIGDADEKYQFVKQLNVF